MRTILSDISRKIYFYFLIVVIVLIFLLWIARLLQYVSFITNVGINTITAIKLSLLLIPEVLIVVFPIAFAVSVAIVYTRYKNSNQIVAAFFSGYNYSQLLQPVLKVGVTLSVILCINSFYVSPICLDSFFSFKTKFLESFIVPEAENISNYQNVSFFFGKKHKNKLQHVVIHDKRNKNRFATLVADSAEIFMDNNRIAVSLRNGNQLNVKNSKFSKLNFDKYTTYIDKKKTDMVKEYRQKTISELLFSANKKDITTAHSKIVSPMVMIIYGLIVAFMVISSEFSRKNKWSPYIQSVLFIICMQFINMLLMKLSMLFVWNNILFYVVYYMVFKKMHRYIVEL